MPAADATGSFLGGLLQGKAQGREQKTQREYLDAQKSHVKNQAKALESQLEMEALKKTILDSMTPEQKQSALFPKSVTTADNLKEILSLFGGGDSGAGAPAPSPPLPFGGGTEMFPLDPSLTSLPQQIAQGQMGGVDSLIAGLTKEDFLRGVMKKEFGAEGPKYNRTAIVEGPDGNPWVAPMNDRGVLDMSKARPAPVKLEMQKGVGEGMAPTETPVNPYNRQPMGSSVQTGPPPTMQVETPTSGGGKVKGIVPLFGGGTKVVGTTAGGVRTELDLVDIPIPATDITKWSDGQGGNPPMGWTPRQAQARGFKQTAEGMAAESGGKAVMVAQALQDIEAAEKMFFPKPGSFDRRLAISAQMGLPEWMSEGSQTAVSLMMNAASAKLRIETGATARPEEQKDVIARFVPSWKDTEKSARGKMTRFREFMRAGKFILDPKGRIMIVEGPTVKAKPDLSLGKKKDPSRMTDDELLKALK